MYVDDALVSCDSVDATVQARRDLIEILHYPDILSENHRTSTEDRAFDKDLIVPTLGLRWTPSTDEFSYTVPELSTITTVTKRAILSDVARIYDPTGWLAPVTVRAKMLLQNLWLQGHDWEQPMDNTTTELWLDFRRKLEALQTCRIPRWLGVNSKSSRMLHGFSNASERAYATAIYLVSQDASHLLTAKSKVAPICSVSVPQLELCGATLLARLMQKVLQDFNLTIASINCWKDSQIVLAWLQKPPCPWKVFVANRVSEIHSLLRNAAWSHVASKHNPADVASRGCSPDQLQGNELWWRGPSWLLSSTSFATIEEPAISTQLERRIDRAYCLRWRNCLASTKAQYTSTTITATEITAARINITRAVQVYHFREEIHRLHKGDDHYRSARLRRHHPYLDEDDLLRVGGRLTHSLKPYNERHPLVIPKTSHLERLLVLRAHEVTLHGGPQLVQNFLRRQWWILQAGSLIRRVIHSCITCTRYQGRRLQQFMASLPEPRVTPSRPFTVTGIDYAGPFALRTSKGRGQKSFKGYVAIFVCFATIPLEVVSDYRTKTFLMALRRFFAKRGLSRTMYSDCGTTF
uniref:Integrase zinc-binding domain-containing protein n=1 Tax=Trichogramma kaykai TaxID=54128 RepID=A0ABD2VVW4_9HYME